MTPREPYAEDDDGPEDDDLDPVFVVEPRSARAPTPADIDRHRATKRHALLGLAVVVVIVGVTITLVALLVSTPGTLSTPASTAQSWGRAVVNGDRSAARALQCRPDLKLADTLRLVLVSPSDARSGKAVRAGRTHWQVPLTFYGPTGRVQVRDRIDVIERDGRYLVC